MGAAMFVAMFVALFVVIFLPLFVSGKQLRAAEDRARARRMAEHRMNARLLRLNNLMVPRGSLHRLAKGRLHLVQ